MRLLRHVGLAFVLLLSIWGLADVQAQAPDGLAHHAAVLVQYAPGQVATRCVGFNEDSISGFEALKRAGFGLISESSGSMGALVCSIDGTGCDYPNEACACRCQGAECTYWAYSHQIDGVWRYSPVGASTYQVRDGAVEGWAWGGGSVNSGSTPPLVDWSTVCAAVAAPLATNTAALPTAEPPTATPLPPTPPPATSVAPTATRASAAPTATTAPAAPTATTAPAALTATTAPAPSTATAVPTLPSTATASSVLASATPVSTAPAPPASATAAAGAPAGGVATPTAAPANSAVATSVGAYVLVIVVALVLVLAALWRRRR